ncbi:hypothetical protein ACFCXP_37595 [Streptomyces niveus]|uniref:hypothetical protein n=1 Tax=Streptomyces niveus TaxID=193462 RepID=UPI0035D83052
MTSPITFEQVVARNVDALTYHLGCNVTTLAPDDFVRELDETGKVLTSSSLADLQLTGQEMTSAATYLADALELHDDDPDRPVLLRRASAHLDDIDI